MFKSKMKWVEQGEKPTKYFHNLEKNKLWGKIGQRGETRKWRENPAQVNEEIEVFYTKMYTTKISGQSCIWAKV